MDSMLTGNIVFQVIMIPICVSIFIATHILKKAIKNNKSQNCGKIILKGGNRLQLFVDKIDLIIVVYKIK